MRERRRAAPSARARRGADRGRRSSAYLDGDYDLPADWRPERPGHVYEHVGEVLDDHPGWAASPLSMELHPIEERAGESMRAALGHVAEFARRQVEFETGRGPEGAAGPWRHVLDAAESGLATDDGMERR